jgi:hypothetical protein
LESSRSKSVNLPQIIKDIKGSFGTMIWKIVTLNRNHQTQKTTFTKKRQRMSISRQDMECLATPILCKRPAVPHRHAITAMI